MSDTTTKPATTFTYEAWRHGGWYVNEVRYPSGAVGCVSRNYADKKWRVVSGDHETTYPSRDAAAQAELELAQQEWVKIRQHINYLLYRQIAEALPADLLNKVRSYAHTDIVLRVAANDVAIGQPISAITSAPKSETHQRSRQSERRHNHGYHAGSRSRPDRGHHHQVRPDPG